MLYNQPQASLELYRWAFEFSGEHAILDSPSSVGAHCQQNVHTAGSGGNYYVYMHSVHSKPLDYSYGR
jgi:hypothetical protein